MNKKIFFLLLILIIVFGLYYYFFRYRQFDLKNNITSEKLNKVEDLKEKKDLLIEKVDKFKEEKIKAFEEKTSDFLNQKKESLMDVLKEKISENLVDLGQKIVKFGINLNSEENSEENYKKINKSLSQVAIFVKNNEVFSLLINQGEEYKIDWGDGLISEGKIDKKEFVLKHVWQNIGNYYLKLEVKEKENKYYFSLPVIVY